MADQSKKRTYTNGEISIVWQADKCIHVGNCVRGLPEVFNPKARPWVNVEAATTDALINQVNACPSGALSYFRNNESPIIDKNTINMKSTVECIPNGPLKVVGEVKVINSDGTETIKESNAFLCRCGASTNKPFCDGAHKKSGFEG